MSEIFDKTDSSLNDFSREPEVPEFIIETDDETRPPVETGRKEKPGRRWLRGILEALIIALTVIVAFSAYKVWNYYMNIGVPISTSPSENISKLQAEPVKERAEVVLSSDSILGVALDFYAIHGLRASIEFEEPDTTDTSVFLYSRSADHQADGTYL